MSDLSPPEASIIRPRHYWIWVVMAVWVVACCGVLTFGLLSQEPIATTSGIFGLLAVVPFPFVAVVQLGEQSSSARVVTICSWAVAIMCSSCLAVSLVTAAYLTPNQQLAPGAGLHILIAFALSVVAGVLGLGCYLPAGRQLASRCLPIDPTSFTAATGLALAVPMTFFCLIPLAVTGKVAIGLVEANKQNQAMPSYMLLFGLVGQLVWLVMFSIMAGGFPIRRDYRATLARLGVSRIGWPRIGIAIGVAVALVACIVSLLIGRQWLWEQLGWPTTDDKAFEQMLGDIKTWYGAIILGVVAGISEELLVRGLLQPRLGLILSNLLFMAAHAFQYWWDGLVLVFLIGLVCGLVRKRFNTTTSMIVHGLYDTIMVLLGTYGEDWFK